MSMTREEAIKNREEFLQYLFNPNIFRQEEENDD